MKRLLHPARSSNFEFEPATDRVDQYGRLLRYVIRATDGLNRERPLGRRRWLAFRSSNRLELADGLFRPRRRCQERFA